jgi:hypothetical protein
MLLNPGFLHGEAGRERHQSSDFGKSYKEWQYSPQEKWFFQPAVLQELLLIVECEAYSAY